MDGPIGDPDSRMRFLTSNARFFLGAPTLEYHDPRPMDWITTSTFLDDLKSFDNGGTWHRFVDTFRPAIVNFNVKLGLAEADAEDAAQSALLAFAEGFREGVYRRERGPLRRWLFSLAYRKAIDVLRDRERRGARQRNGAPVDELAQQIPDEHRIEKLWESEWQSFVLRHCLQRVKEEVRASSFDAFSLLVLQEKSPDDVAAELGMSRNAVYLAKHRVLKRLNELRREFEQRS